VTILGAIVRPDHVVSWADTQIFDREDLSPFGFETKLHIAGGGSVIGAGSGWGSLIRHADIALLNASDVDDAAKRVSTAFRKHMVAAVDSTRYGDPETFAGHTYIAAGFSDQAGRMLGYRLRSAGLFRPILTPRLAQPYLPEIENFDPHHDTDIARFARKQIDVLRGHFPEATGGDLSIVTLGPTGAFMRTIRDFYPLAATGPTSERAAA